MRTPAILRAALRRTAVLAAACAALGVASKRVHAQPVSGVGAGVTAVTVMVCDDPQGCTREWTALADHCTALGVPLLDFDAVAAAGPGGGDARAALDDALSASRSRPGLATLEAARVAFQETPLTLHADVGFDLWLRLGAARLGSGDIAGADVAFSAAAASSGARVYDLPQLSGEAIDRYLGAAARRPDGASLTVSADHAAAVVFVDGQPVGIAPLLVDLPAGWHRISVERPGRRTAWVGEVTLPPGQRLAVAATIAADDAPAALKQAVVGAINGTDPPPELAQALADWGRSRGLRRIRFVVLREPKASGRVPEERVRDPGGGLWDVDAAWLDTSAARFEPRGPGPSTLRAAADPERFTLGMGLGWVRLQQTLASGSDPHDHLSLEVTGLAKLSDHVAIDARVGLWRAAQPWYLYDDWLAREVVPVAAGVRWSPGSSGFYLGAQALAVVPVALGGQGLVGFVWRPTTRWRIGVEGRGGATDKGPIGGAGLSLGFAG